MKNFALILLVIVSLSSCSRARIAISETEIPDEVFFLEDQVKPYTGVCVINFYNLDVVKEEMTYIKGILNGPMTSYFADGTVKRRGSYINGRMDGKWESWYKNGRRRYIATYSNDTLNGEYMEWYDTGVLKEEGLYAQNFRLGDWAEYDEAGMKIRKMITD